LVASFLYWNGEFTRLLHNYIIDRVFQSRVAAARNLKGEALLS
jgi:hypothetical protein